MSQITASMVKDLREKTGAGMMDCKKALQESGADIEKAVDWLRQKVLQKLQNVQTAPPKKASSSSKPPVTTKKPLPLK